MIQEKEIENGVQGNGWVGGESIYYICLGFKFNFQNLRIKVNIVMFISDFSIVKVGLGRFLVFFDQG